MRPERLTEIADALRDAGVPEQVVNYATSVGLSARIYHITEFFYIAIMAAGFVFASFYLWPYLDGVTADIAISHAEETGALLYKYNFGISLILGIFGWIFGSGALVLFGQSASQRLRANSFVFSVIYGMRQRSTRWIVRRGIAKSRNEANPVRYVRRATFSWLMAMTIPAALLMTISALGVVRDVNAHSIYTADAYTNSPLLPLGSTTREWSSAVSVETGCNHVERKGKISDSMIYEVTFSDGATTQIGDANPLNGSWLSATEEIDAKLRLTGATFSPWDWLGRDPMHPLCIAALRDRFPDSDFERIQRLLRLPR